MFYSSKILAIAMLSVAVAALSGCGKGNQSSDTVSSGGASTLRKSNYKANDKQLVQGSNNIPVYSTPDSARKALRRAPDQTVDEGGGVVTQYYNSDQTNANSERLKLRYSQNRLIGKEIVPGEQSASVPAEVNASARNNGAINVQGLDSTDSSANARSTKGLGSNNYYGSSSPNAPGLRGGSNYDRANAQSNDDFNSRLNQTQRRN